MASNRPQVASIGSAARFVVLTGLSGAGKSEAIHALEDLGYFCVDNLPTSLIPVFAELVSDPSGGIDRAAVVVDVRDRQFFDEFSGVLRGLRRRKGLGAILIFLEADDAALVRRFSETRRPHPLAQDRSMLEAILEERTRFEAVKASADKVFDTSNLTAHDLRRAFRELSRGRSKTYLVTTLLSFGYKHGVPLESDLLFDVRFLPNPHFVPALRRLTGREPTTVFLEKLTDLLRFLIPQYAKEGKSYLTVGIGCTGGRHRSVVIADRLRQSLGGLDGVRLRVKHRDIENE